MAWLELDCVCDERHADALSDALIACGALSVSVEDANAGGMAEVPIYGEPGIPQGRLWQRNRVVALVDQATDCAGLIERAAGMCGLADLRYTSRVVHDQDWVRQTQAQFEPVRISNRLWIVPSWHQAPAAPSIAIRLDPGLAFGTGSHPTTRLCLAWLDQADLRGRLVLDYGCGSGILAIAAARLGARQVVATDIDPQALAASRANAAANQAAVDVRDIDEVRDIRADVLVANILTNPLKVLAPAFSRHLADAGQIVLSGILEEQEGDVIAAYAPWVRLRPHAREDGWSCLHGTRDS
ncbi:MAG: 50S ribosomal protein L11 methyltransferase [Burkholderiales bacterium]|nr:50S ribosomal protein L11 methyltransferase [Burkholderiales bacterium]